MLINTPFLLVIHAGAHPNSGCEVTPCATFGHLRNSERYFPVVFFPKAVFRKICLHSFKFYTHVSVLPLHNSSPPAYRLPMPATKTATTANQSPLSAVIDGAESPLHGSWRATCSQLAPLLVWNVLLGTHSARGAYQQLPCVVARGIIHAVVKGDDRYDWGQRRHRTHG